MIIFYERLRQLIFKIFIFESYDSGSTLKWKFSKGMWKKGKNQDKGGESYERIFENQL
jgi:hypothetical protein